ncbi:MAG: hypothetical protein ACRC6X_07775 [Culicoidibacterales bacterium]
MKEYYKIVKKNADDKGLKSVINLLLYLDREINLTNTALKFNQKSVVWEEISITSFANGRGMLTITNKLECSKVSLEREVKKLQEAGINFDKVWISDYRKLFIFEMSGLNLESLILLIEQNSAFSMNEMQSGTNFFSPYGGKLEYSSFGEIELSREEISGEVFQIVFLMGDATEPNLLEVRKIIESFKSEYIIMDRLSFSYFIEDDYYIIELYTSNLKRKEVSAIKFREEIALFSKWLFSSLKGTEKILSGFEIIMDAVEICQITENMDGVIYYFQRDGSGGSK